MIKRIHHLNFIVRDLAHAASKFSRLFDQPVPPVEELPQRGVRLMRFRLGESWFILVQPVDPDSVPGRILHERGEGFFLVSGQVDDLRGERARLRAAGLGAEAGEVRAGLDDWQVLDLDPAALCGVSFQLVQAGED